MNQTKVKYLLSDQEPAWTSKIFQDFVKQFGIKHRFYEKYDVSDVIETNEREKTRGTHSATSLVDRLIRTIRMMAYNINQKSEIDPNLMKYLINEYNNSPHTTLSKYLKINVSPNEVDANPDYEERIVLAIMSENMKLQFSPEYWVSNYVRVRNEANSFDKVKPKLLPGKWKVIGKDGGLIKLKQGKNEIKVNRWMVKNVYN